MFRKRGSVVGAIVLVSMLVSTASAQQRPAFGQALRHVPGRILVKFNDDVSDEQAARVLGSVRGRSQGRLHERGAHIVAVPSNGNEEALVQELAARPEVAFAELDKLVPPADLTPNDPLYAGSEWHLPRISAPAAWSTTTGSSNIIVAVIDTGVYGGHEDLAAKMVPGWNTYNGTSDSSDVYGHGTQVAGTIAAMSNNGLGVASVCWNCMIMPIRASDATGYASYSALANGVYWAADHGARVANMSYIVSDSSTVTAAAQYFQGKGGVVTSSAGNYSTFDGTADNPYILTVSATDQNDVLYSWSNTGNNIDLAAPGCIYTTMNGGGYVSNCGTSFSAPIVAGVAALVLSANPSLSGAQVTSFLKQSADDLGPAGWDTGYGWGRVNAARAVSLAGGSADTTAPTVSITSPGPGATVSGTAAVQASASDNVGVSTVTFFVDGVQVAVGSVAPFAYSWDTTTAANASHTLKATARDAAGNSTSSSVTVTVNNPVPDTTLPVVSVTSPASGSTVSGTVTIQAAASDNVGVSSVSFYADGALKCTVSAAPFACSWNTTSTGNGGHTVSATARDAAGNTASSSVGVTVSNIVSDTTPPTVAITSPSGSVVSGTVSIQASASDNVGVASVTFLIDGVQVAIVSSAPYAYSWNTASTTNTSHTLTATARDGAGNSSSAALVVTVNNGSPSGDVTPPSVSIISPSAGSFISGNVNITLGASDNVRVTRVDVYADGALIGSATSAPYSVRWNTNGGKVASGAHVLQGKAYDAAGNVGMSIPVTVYK